MSEKKCCVPGCGFDSEILHKFPNPDKDIDRFKTWIYNVGGDIMTQDNEYVFKNRRVCHSHFEVKYHTRSKMLSPNAVPTLNLTKFSFGKKHPLIDITSNNPPVTPSTSGLSYPGKRSQTYITYKPLNTPPATPSTSAKKRPLVIVDTECETKSKLSNDTGPHSQRRDCDKKDDALKKLNVGDASTQTPECNKAVDADIIKSNESFGVFIAQELSNVPLIKRRQIMSEIIRLFEH